MIRSELSELVFLFDKTTGTYLSEDGMAILWTRDHAEVHVQAFPRFEVKPFRGVSPTDHSWVLLAEDDKPVYIGPR